MLHPYMAVESLCFLCSLPSLTLSRATALLSEDPASSPRLVPPVGLQAIADLVHCGFLTTALTTAVPPSVDFTL